MSNRTIFILAAAGAVLLYLSRSVMDLNRLVFKLAGFRNLQSAGGNVSLVIDVLIANPTNSTFPLYDTFLEGTILVNDFALGRTQTHVNALLVPGQQIVVPLTVTLNSSTFAGGVAALLATLQQNSTNLELLGTVTIKGVQLPLNIRYEYGH